MTSPVPAWRRATEMEARWPAGAAVLLAIVLQVLSPERSLSWARWVLPAAELVLLVVVAAVNPYRRSTPERDLRWVSLALAWVVGAVNGVFAVLLVIDIVDGRPTTALTLLGSGAAIWLTNVLSFALLYWEFDRGGPAARAAGSRRYPDFLFVQMQSQPDFADPRWEPRFADYLYLSFTNATAFSPTDVMPMTRWAKMTMMAQSAVSLVVVALVIARAVNVLGS